jgi:hypothetical protein
MRPLHAFTPLVLTFIMTLLLGACGPAPEEGGGEGVHPSDVPEMQETHIEDEPSVDMSNAPDPRAVPLDRRERWVYEPLGKLVVESIEVWPDQHVAELTIVNLIHSDMTEVTLMIAFADRQGGLIEYEDLYIGELPAQSRATRRISFPAHAGFMWNRSSMATIDENGGER